MDEAEKMIFFVRHGVENPDSRRKEERVRQMSFSSGPGVSANQGLMVKVDAARAEHRRYLADLAHCKEIQAKRIQEKNSEIKRM
jgi:hypothetical protein